MGLVASQGRLLMLTARRSDMELQMQFINQARMFLAQQNAQLVQLNVGFDPTSPAGQQFQAFMAALQLQDKALEIQLRNAETQHKAVANEIEAVGKVIDKNVDAFKLTGFA